MQGESVMRVVEPFPHVTGAWISRQTFFCFLYHKRLRNWWQLFPVRGWLPLLFFSYGAKKGGTTRIIVPDPAAVGSGAFFIRKKGAVI